MSFDLEPLDGTSVESGISALREQGFKELDPNKDWLNKESFQPMDEPVLPAELPNLNGRPLAVMAKATGEETTGGHRYMVVLVAIHGPKGNWKQRIFEGCRIKRVGKGKLKDTVIRI